MDKMKKDYFAQLQEIFGNTGRESVIDHFGKNYFDGIEGWQFPIVTIKKYNQGGKLLTMDLDIPCPCKLNCNYCFAKESAYYRPQAGDRPLTMQKIKQSLLEAKAMGLKSAKIIGFGEPFENSKIFDFIEFASSYDIHLVIFTSAYTLGERTFGENKKKVIDFLFDHKVSLMIKFHTLDQRKEVEIIGYEKYPAQRDEILRLFLEHGGFNNASPTRLGLENVIATGNVDELAAIYEYFKIYRNVHIDIDPPVPVGRTTTKEECQQIGLSEEKLLELYKRIYFINKKFNVPFLGISPFIGNPPCSQLPNGLYLTLSGKVMSCCGGNEQYGDVNDGESIAEIFLRNPHRFKSENVYHNCPYREKAGILSVDFIEKINQLIQQKT